MTHYRVIDTLTKEQLIDEIHKFKCLKLKGLNLSKMSKQDIILHLQSQKCPKIKELMVRVKHK